MIVKQVSRRQCFAAPTSFDKQQGELFLALRAAEGLVYDREFITREEEAALLSESPVCH